MVVGELATERTPAPPELAITETDVSRPIGRVGIVPDVVRQRPCRRLVRPSLLVPTTPRVALRLVFETDQPLKMVVPIPRRQAEQPVGQGVAQGEVHARQVAVA